MNRATIFDLIDKALARTITFPEIIATLIKEDVESYHVDFLRNEFRYYASSGEAFVAPVALVHDAVAAEFSVEQLQAINQRGESGLAGYVDFVIEAPAAGCACYIVYLNGKKVRYFGRNGGEHIQYLPSAGAR